AVTAQHPGLAALYRAVAVGAVAVCGIATNICCFFAARDLRRAGFRVLLVEDASAGIDVPTAGLLQAAARQEGQGIGIEYVTTNALVYCSRPGSDPAPPGTSAYDHNVPSTGAPRTNGVSATNRSPSGNRTRRMVGYLG